MHENSQKFLKYDITAKKLILSNHDSDYCLFSIENYRSSINSDNLYVKSGHPIKLKAASFHEANQNLFVSLRFSPEEKIESKNSSDKSIFKSGEQDDKEKNLNLLGSKELLRHSPTKSTKSLQAIQIQPNDQLNHSDQADQPQEAQFTPKSMRSSKSIKSSKSLKSPVPVIDKKSFHFEKDKAERSGNEKKSVKIVKNDSSPNDDSDSRADENEPPIIEFEHDKKIEDYQIWDDKERKYFKEPDVIFEEYSHMRWRLNVYSTFTHEDKLLLFGDYINLVRYNSGTCLTVGKIIKIILLNI